MLISDSDYKASGIYIGMKQRSSQMKDFIYRVRPDGLSLLNISKIDQRIRTAAKFIVNSKNVVVVGRKMVSETPIEKFQEVTGAHTVVGRFMPGTLTNPSYKKFYEADLIIIVDPVADHQALSEAVKARIPVIAICDTFNDTKNVDLIVPGNNKSAKSIGTLFWLISREVSKLKGGIKDYSDFKHNIDDFVGEIKVEDEQEEVEGY